MEPPRQQSESKKDSRKTTTADNLLETAQNYGNVVTNKYPSAESDRGPEAARERNIDQSELSIGLGTIKDN